MKKLLFFFLCFFTLETFAQKRSINNKLSTEHIFIPATKIAIIPSLGVVFYTTSKCTAMLHCKNATHFIIILKLCTYYLYTYSISRRLSVAF
ncbi:hypothetical protein HNP25_004381 [Arcicella rosea]|uniref:Uncharacterized protein n=1 Tax=Arcicella rosea TaxID=502909 RepID=A0A841EPJ1_9BACT|nr:hypothetical protein [Arcicella rosea]